MERGSLVERGSSVVECRTLNRVREPGFEALNNDISESNYNNYAADHNSIRRKSA